MAPAGVPKEGERAARRPARFTLSLTLLTLLALAAWACRGKPDAIAAGHAAGAPRPAARAEAAGYDLRPAERDAINAFLLRNAQLRLATDEDRRPPVEGEDVRDLYGVYHPYFVRGELNNDGVLDFVAGFVRRESDRDAPWFSVVVFSGSEGSGFATETVLERDVSLADGDVSVDRDTIVITPDLSEEATRRYRWDPAARSYVFDLDAPDEQEPVPLMQT